MIRLKVTLIMEFNVVVNVRRIYQDTRNTSSNWRQNNRIFHPLTQRQFGNRFRVGNRVTMRLIYPPNKMYINGAIERIIPYPIAQAWVGSYNIDDTFANEPFTHVLVIKP
jgi:hypothetical protein